jgi:hypothetical protein
MSLRKKLMEKIKARITQALGRVADRIHPRNASGNNTSKM